MALKNKSKIAGGIARSKSLSSARRSEIAKKAATARWAAKKADVEKESSVIQCNATMPPAQAHMGVNSASWPLDAGKHFAAHWPSSISQNDFDEIKAFLGMLEKRLERAVETKDD